LQFPNRKRNQTRINRVLEAWPRRTRSCVPGSCVIRFPRRPDHPNRIHRRRERLPAVRCSFAHSTTNPIWDPRVSQIPRLSAQHSRTKIPVRCDHIAVTTPARLLAPNIYIPIILYTYSSKWSSATCLKHKHYNNFYGLKHGFQKPTI